MSTPEPKFALVGISFRQVGFEGLAPLTLGRDEAAARAALKQALGADECVYVATCNRVECYLAGAKLPSAEALRERAREVFQVEAELVAVKLGGAAVQHLFQVAASLDSFVVGETDIVRQLRRALATATEEELSGPELQRLFERATQCAARVRKETRLSETPVSVASLAVRKIERHFGAGGPGSSVLVGVGDMTRKVAAALGRHGGARLFVNRTLAPARALAERFGGEARTLDEFVARPPAEIDLVFSATSATEVVIPATALEPAMRNRAGRAPIIVCDLGVPRDVDPNLEGREGVVLMALEHLEVLAELNRARLEEELAKARVIVSEGALRLVREERFRALADCSTHAILEARLAHLSDADRETILRFATSLAERFARQPEHFEGAHPSPSSPVLDSASQP